MKCIAATKCSSSTTAKIYEVPTDAGAKVVQTVHMQQKSIGYANLLFNKYIQHYREIMTF
uniref:Uncharacterized protein n=2 Tax=Anguilla anguilla TaxID=7936 RepID=A0A0E9UHA0_ANGAN